MGYPTWVFLEAFIDPLISMATANLATITYTYVK